MRLLVIMALCFLAVPAFAQQKVNPANVAEVYRQQRIAADDKVAVCSAAVGEMQARIAELEKQLAAQKPPAPATAPAAPASAPADPTE
jgi:hypothetical protein